MRRCSSLKLAVKNQNTAIVLSALREKRTTILAWFFSGIVAMYFEAIAIAAELRDYPGGPTALAKSIMPTIEGIRIIRWPADRLDTLGGYLCYHNVVLFNYFLALFAAVQGARLIRHLEENGAIAFYLSATATRGKLIALRSLAYFLSQLIISLGLGLGTALALAASDEANTSGAFITLLAGGICIFPFFGAGLLISQFMKNSRTASGITSILVTLIYVLGNIGDKYTWLTWIKYISPFHYANLSRPIIPGFSTNYWSWVLMFAVGLIFIFISNLLLNRRDINAVSIERISSERKVKVTKFVPKTLIGDSLWRQRYGLIAWVLTSSIFIGVFISMMNSIVGVWEDFAFLQQFAAGGFGDTAAKQYLAMVYEVLPPFLAGFVITQSSRWTLDLNQGRVPLFLSAPISIGRLIFGRVVATLIGAELIIIFNLATVAIGSLNQNVELYPNSIFRVFVMTNLFVIAFTAISALLVAILHGKSATQVVAIYVGA
ncbi:MAG: ABC transporter permease subunit, partial [Candidatus Nanopelagicaceae bacterium]